MTGDAGDNFLPPDLGALGAEVVEMGVEGQPPGAASVLATHHDALMARSGVVMVGEGIDALGRPAIMIGVRTSRDLTRLPRELDGVPVVAQVIGDVDAL